MSFGEHLEELRRALIWALLSIGIGTVAGFCVGKWVVDIITDPLKTALEAHYSNVALNDYKERIADWEAKSIPVPPELKDEAILRKWVQGDRMLWEETYVRPQELLQGLQQMYPDQFGKVELPLVDKEHPLSSQNMIPIFTWHHSKDDLRLRVMTMNAQEGFVVLMKASIVAGIIISSPLVFYFVWQFVAAGLYPHEKRYVYVFLPFSLGLFLSGVLVAYFFAFPLLLKFFFEINQWLGIDLDLRLSEWLSLVLMMPLGFGLSFQLPLIMLFLERIGVCSIQMYWSKWRIAVLLLAVASMILTPTTDPQSMMLMFVPLALLYFGGIFLCQLMPRSQLESPRGRRLWKRS